MTNRLNAPKLRFGLIFGGRSGEHAISLLSARSVLAAIDTARYEVTQIGITPLGSWFVSKPDGPDVLAILEQGIPSDTVPVVMLPLPERSGLFGLVKQNSKNSLVLFQELDVVFPLLHGTFGEDGTIQGLFEMSGLAYVGAGVLGSALGMDKAAFKDVMRANGIPVVESILALRSEIESNMDRVIRRAEALSGYPLFTKPANLGSSVGISKCRNRSDLVEGLMEAALYDRRILIERGIDGREIEVSVLGNSQPETSIPGEVVPAGDFYTYASKYIDNRSQLLIPAPISREKAEEIRELAVRSFKAIDCAGMLRADFLLDKDTGEVFLNEINTIPGFTQISMYPKLWEASGLSYPRLIDRLVELALERKLDRDRTIHEYSREERRHLS